MSDGNSGRVAVILAIIAAISGWGTAAITNFGQLTGQGSELDQLREKIKELEQTNSGLQEKIIQCNSNKSTLINECTKPTAKKQNLTEPPKARVHEAIVDSWFCVVKPEGTADPYGGCDVSRGDIQLRAGIEKTVLIPVGLNKIPSDAKVETLIKVTGGKYFSLFKSVDAKYVNGHLEVTILPNEYGGYNDHLQFAIAYTN